MCKTLEEVVGKINTIKVLAVITVTVIVYQACGLLNEQDSFKVHSFEAERKISYNIAKKKLCVGVHGVQRQAEVTKKQLP